MEMPQLQFDENHIRDVIDRVVDRTFRMDFSWDWPGGVAFYGVAEAYEATGNERYISCCRDGLTRSWKTDCLSYPLTACRSDMR